MWHSEDDVLRDIASLNDFGTPEDNESYKILYSVGRGLKAKEKSKHTEKFVDSKTGENISVEDAEFVISNNTYKSKGRGNVLGSFFRTNLQLQQQLRLARPLGSGDGAVESYYGKNRSTENFRRFSSDHELEAQTSDSTDKNKADSKSNQIRKRIKATRISNLQGNVLISNLLSKHRTDLDSTNQQDFTDDFDEKRIQYVSVTSKKDDKSNKINEEKMGAVNDLNISDLSLSNERKRNTVDKKSENYSKMNTCGNLLNKRFVENENSKENFGLNRIDFNSTNAENEKSEKYRDRGVTLNRLRKCNSNDTKSSVEEGESTSFSKHFVPAETMLFSDEDFPPL